MSGIKKINYCIDCDLALGNAYAFRNHTRQVHPSWIRFKIEDSTQICLFTKCDLTYEDEDEFNEHLKEINLKQHLENHHKPNPEPTVEEKDEKHDNVNNDTEV